MRMRRKPYARPELAAWEHHIDKPTEHRGHWAELFEKQQPMWLELGCGKGGFSAELAAAHPEINLVAVDIKSEVLVVAKRNIERVYAALDRPITNVKILPQQIEILETAFAPPDQFERIYINFCNPWNKAPQKKKRLTHSKLLVKYRELLVPGGEIRFKTDNDELFEDTLGYFAECGFEVYDLTRDLHADNSRENYETEHEKMFSEQGIPIKYAAARMVELKKEEKTDE